MLKKIKNLTKNQRGLTLVELLAVVVILGIVSSIATVSIGSVIQNSREDAAIAEAIQIINAADIYVASNGTGTTGELTLNATRLEEFISATGSMNPGWTVDVSENGNIVTIDGTATAGSRTVTFNDASLADLNQGRAGAVTETSANAPVVIN